MAVASVHWAVVGDGCGMMTTTTWRKSWQIDHSPSSLSNEISLHITTSSLSGHHIKYSLHTHTSSVRGLDYSRVVSSDIHVVIHVAATDFTPVTMLR